MSVKNINRNKIIKLTLAFAMVLSLGLCLAFTSLGSATVAFAEESVNTSSATNATISTFAEELETGAGITLSDVALARDNAPNPANAVASAEQTAVITLSGDLWSAVQSGRVKATLLASGSNSYATLQGTASVKDAGYTVSGAMTGSGKFSTANTTYEDRVLSEEEVLLDSANGNEIRITYYATHTAFDSKTTLGENVAESKVEGNMTFKLKLWFEKVVVTIDSTNGGIIKDAGGNEIDLTSGQKEMTLGFGDSISFTAEPKSGYYFMGWKKVGVTGENVTGLTIDLGKSVNIPSGEKPNYKAEFQIINVVQDAENNYEYSGSPNGPVVRSTAYTGIYYVTHRYTGVTVSGENVDVKSEGLEDIVAAPIRAGQFNYTCEFFYRVNNGNEITKGERIGGVSIDFQIKKNTPTVKRGQDNASSVTISYGDNLDDLDLSYTATNSVDTLVNLSGTLEVYLGEEKIELTKILPLSEDGTDYTLRFTPNDLNNYEILNTPFKIYVKDDMSDEGTNIDGESRAYVVTKSIVTEIDGSVQSNYASLNAPVGAELLKVSLRATMTDESGQYFFIGWRIVVSEDGSFTSSSYVYNYLNSGKVTRDVNGEITAIDGLAYDYYLPYYANVTNAELAKYTHAIFQAIFVKDTTCGTSVDTLTIPYSGFPSSIVPTFSPQRAYYQFGFGELNYYHASDLDTAVSSIPTAIGNHYLKYEIINTAVSNTVVDVRTIKYNVTIGEVKAEIDEKNSILYGGYDKNTGWATKMYYKLSVDGLLSGGADSYYYSLDNGETWIKIDGIIADASGCEISFATPDVVNDTQVFGFIFMATHPTNGTPMMLGENTYNVVAGTNYYCVAKIDTFVPTLEAVTETANLNGTWTRDDVNFTALASFGGSGAVIDVCYVKNGSTYTKLDSNIDFAYGTDASKTEGVSVAFAIKNEYSGNVKFRIRTGSGIVTVVDTPFRVNLDKTVPTFGEQSKDHVSSSTQGWIGVTTRVTFEIINEGGSSLLQPTATDALGNSVSVASIGGGKYRVEVNNSLSCIVVAMDEAGNSNIMEIQEKVDVEPVNYEYSADSYLAGNWAKLGSVVSFDMNMGASGARIRCSVDGSAYIPVTEFFGAEIGAINKEFTLSYEIPYSADVKTYNFQIETGAGVFIDVPFGEVKFDIEAPTYTLLTDLSAYQGSRWTSNVIVAEFKAEDVLGTVNSGIENSGVTVDNGGVINALGGGKYSLTIDKCTVFNVSIKDLAGNEVILELQANVDTVLPTLELKAYIGGGNPLDVSEEPTLEDNDESNLYDFTRWITKKDAEPWVRLEFTINLTASGSRLEYSNNNGASWSSLTPTYMPEAGQVSGVISTRTYITTEQNRKYLFRLATGSGKYELYEHEDATELYVKLDFTAPTLRSESFRVGSNANFDLKNVWVNQDGQYRITLQDTTLGSGVDTDSIVLKEYSLDTEDTAILDGSAVAIDRQMTRSGDYFVFDMTEAKKYLLTFRDLAGNDYEGEIFVSHVDKTEGFTLNVKASWYDQNEVGSELTSSTWLGVEDYVVFEGTPSFAGAGFGPSGGEMQFSIDGGITYSSVKTINGEEISVTEILGGKYELAVSAEQVNTYKFRLITGAGVEYVLNQEFIVQKDNLTPTISSALAYQDGNVYSGEWTNKNLRFVLGVNVGMSGGELYYGVGETRDSAVWTKIIDLNKNVGLENTYYYTLENSAYGNYYFKVVNGKGTSAESESEHLVKLDNTAIVAEVEATSNGASVSSASWVAGETKIYPTIKEIGASGISKVYVKVGGGEYQEVTTEGYFVLLNANTPALTEYIFKVVSVSGVEAETAMFSIGYDDVAPAFEYYLSGIKLPSGNVFEDWYVSDVTVEVQLTATPNSATNIYYAYRDNANGATYSDWQEVESIFVLTDGAVLGGLDRYYKIKVVTASGLEVVKEERYLPIDTFKYSVTVNSYVDGVRSDEEHSFATIIGASDEETYYKKGDSVTVAITPNATYTIKTINEFVGDKETLLFNFSYEDSLRITQSKVYTIGGESITLDVNFYKEITIVYGEEGQGLLQHLQAGEVKEVSFAVAEEGFDEFFGSIKDLVSRRYLNGSSIFLKANTIEHIGEYQVTLTSLNENLVIVNPAEKLTVVYFEGEGTELSPYEVRNLSDFYYIDEYMYYKDEYEVEDARAYLGSNRRKAYFVQTGDLELASNFTPNGDKGEEYTSEFTGVYDGNGYEVWYDGTILRSGDFGLFLNISSDATIKNLGVRYNLKIVDATNASVGLIVANAPSKGGISAVYAIGDITIVDSVNVNVGGIIGLLGKGSLISASFSDVSISVTQSSGHFGGMVGVADGAYTANVYTTSKLTLTDSVKYGAVAEPGVQFAYAGALVGYVRNFEDAGSTPGEDNKSFYLDRNVSYDGSIETGLSLGNKETFGNYPALKHSGENIDFFASEVSGSASEVVIINVAREAGKFVLTVGELVKIRIEEVKAEVALEGNGTTESPFLIDSQEKLAYVETFPWATFKQTCDIGLSESVGKTTFSSGVPFVGVYDGGGYSITGATQSVKDQEENVKNVYGGLFGVVSGTIKNLKVVDVALDYEGNDTYYVGGVVGGLFGGRIENVVVSGVIEVNSAKDNAYVGGLFGVAVGGEIVDAITMVNVSATGVNVISGGVGGEIQGKVTLSDVVNVSSVSAHYTEKANVGSTLGALNSQEAKIIRTYHLLKNAYANDKSVSSTIGYNAGATLTDVYAKSYQDVMNTAFKDSVVSLVVGALYPFEGDGTKANPFKIDSYKKLELVGNYMYANFILTDNIVIGDLNDDGKLDTHDGYGYDFGVIGDGATFTGSFDGDGYSIIGLTDSLFEVNAGAITDVTLNLSYKVYAKESDVPESDKVLDVASGKTYTTSKVAVESEDVLFGAVAKVNTATGSLIRVNVSGEIYVRTQGNTKVTLGGLIGVDMGGQVVASQVTASLSVRASQAVVGGLIGEIKYSDRALSQIAMNDVIIGSGINLGGGVVIAGAFVGKIGVQSLYTPDFATATEIIVNGESMGTEVYVGYAKK